jgi:hypothetical protein
MDDRTKMNCKNDQEKFEQTGNPIYLFDAYVKCRKSGQPIEEWILTYFDSVAKQIYDELDERVKGVGPGTRRAESFLYDIMYKGRGDIFNIYLDDQKKIGICFRYLLLKLDDPNRPDLDIRLQIADEFGINDKTIEGWINEKTQQFSSFKKSWKKLKQTIYNTNRNLMYYETKRINIALCRYCELLYLYPKRPIIDIQDQVEKETGIVRTLFHDKVNPLDLRPNIHYDNLQQKQNEEVFKWIKMLTSQK